MIENTHAAESFDALFARLATSEFRRRFRLKAEDIAYIEPFYLKDFVVTTS